MTYNQGSTAAIGAFVWSRTDAKRAISVLTIKQPLLHGVGAMEGRFTADEAKQLLTG